MVKVSAGQRKLSTTQVTWKAKGVAGFMTVVSTITKIFITESVSAERENKVDCIKIQNCVHPLYVQKTLNGTDTHMPLSQTLHLLEA